MKKSVVAMEKQIICHVHGETEISDLKIGASMMTSPAFIS